MSKQNFLKLFVVGFVAGGLIVSAQAKMTPSKKKTNRMVAQEVPASGLGPFNRARANELASALGINSIDCTATGSRAVGGDSCNAVLDRLVVAKDAGLTLSPAIRYIRIVSDDSNPTYFPQEIPRGRPDGMPRVQSTSFVGEWQINVSASVDEIRFGADIGRRLTVVSNLIHREVNCGWVSTLENCLHALSLVESVLNEGLRPRVTIAELQNRALNSYPRIIELNGISQNTTAQEVRTMLQFEFSNDRLEMDTGVTVSRYPIVRSDDLKWVSLIDRLIESHIEFLPKTQISLESTGNSGSSFGSRDSSIQQIYISRNNFDEGNLSLIRSSVAFQRSVQNRISAENRAFFRGVTVSCPNEDPVHCVEAFNEFSAANGFNLIRDSVNNISHPDLRVVVGLGRANLDCHIYADIDPSYMQIEFGFRAPEIAVQGTLRRCRRHER